ncbi:STAS domain-containing protein [Tepidamorphus sp. 3E244]|uniref:STAS domain-containing protein n=1 Tax=Tepidamorphus sp. 3E244 TaxID=3385498 RepID=UPI0038FC9B77
MRLSVETLEGFAVAKISGAIDSHAAGLLSDALVQCIGDGLGRTIVDLSGVQLATRAGIRGLIVAARLVQPGRGAMRICGASGQLADFLEGLSLGHLLKVDATLDEAIENMRAVDGLPGLMAAQIVSIRVPMPQVATNMPAYPASAHADHMPIWQQRSR